MIVQTDAHEQTYPCLHRLITDSLTMGGGNDDDLWFIFFADIFKKYNF